MIVRAISENDRAEWLRMLMVLYPHHPESEHIPAVDAVLNRTEHESLIPEAVFVCERKDGRLAGFLELSVRSRAEPGRSSENAEKIAIVCIEAAKAVLVKIRAA